MHCADCGCWIQEKIKRYADGSEFSEYKAPDGMGQCQILSMETKAEFGCIHFDASDVHVVVSTFDGHPWQFFEMIPCPDCRGKGSNEGACHRCAGTGKVRQYADGYIGEEQTRKHPKESNAVPQVDPGTVLASMPKPNVLQIDAL